MAIPPLTDDQAMEAVLAFRAHNDSATAAAKSLGLPRTTFTSRLKVAAERGLMGPVEALPGFAIRQVTSKSADGTIIQQRKAAGDKYEPTEGLAIKGKTTWVNPEGRITQQVVMERAGAEDHLAAMRSAVEGFKDELPRASPAAVVRTDLRADLMNLFVLTDAHFGALSWREETGHAYDLDIAERLITDWFAAAIELSPPAETAVLAQLGDLAHYDSMESKTPSSGHILDSDTRFPKMVRVIIRTMRRVVRMLLEKHNKVHIVMADANHDPAAEAWLREMFASFYDDEPRITVDSSASTYYVYEHGNTSIYLHHGHKRKIDSIDTVFAGKFREIYGRTKYSYAHLGHLHSDELKSTNLMKVERHETLAAPDAYAANGGWLSGRSAKVITYSREWGEVSRLTLSASMVDGWTNKRSVL